MDPTNKTEDSKPQKGAAKSSPHQRSGWRLSISAVFSIGAALLLALIGGSVLFFVSSAANQQATVIMRETGALIVGRGLEVVEDFFQNEERLGLLAAEVLSDPLVYNAPAELREQLITILSRQTNIKRISYTFASGRKISVQLDHADAPIREVFVRPPNIQDMAEGNLQWMPPYYDPVIGETFMQFTVYIKNPVDNTLSKLALDYPTTLLSRLMGRIKWRDSQVPFILLGRDKVLASSETAFLDFDPSVSTPVPRLSDLQETPLSHIWDDNIDRRVLNTTYSAHVDTLPTGTYLYLYDALKGDNRFPIIIGSYVLASEFNGPFDSLHKVFVAATAFLAVGVLVMFLIGRKLATPIVGLATQANAIRSLNMDGLQALPSSRLEEIDDANQAFNSASVALSAFSRYVPKDLVRVLLESDFEGLNSTELREMTILFSDIAGFTGVASKLSAEETTSLLNMHFQELADCISQTHGTIDKYIGDGCMAFWGAPEIMENHAEAAIEAVHLIAEKLKAEVSEGDGQAEKPRLRIGVHTGTVVVGNIGARERMNYTVVGDAVNVAARLEELGKQVDPEAKVIALASEATINSLSDKSRAKYLGGYQLRGREEAVDVYRIV
ncbi:adenylate/guanylate cyclase domain-containing protein [Pseudovibrio sp. Tun.PSC04-5.I4]|uniref:adenylate/guanylate cyclase domain-containing protein n=1 Tax=Pseudovibrio sp. Tun.PSC04-5.I4 TaxID=1798213 RepID=UPI000883D7D0|nr:adenylate/guanylate cyclase domain-containing protein [Pseudovibrio sp. Tun.PSC04-5.I4]SDQ77566.1 adenylate cyclase [Pseudovibrio sp. Tun.PSC04-5.I4]